MGHAHFGQAGSASIYTSITASYRSAGGRRPEAEDEGDARPQCRTWPEEALPTAVAWPP